MTPPPGVNPETARPETFHATPLWKCPQAVSYVGRLQESSNLWTSTGLTFADFLDQVLTEEVASKTAKHVTMRTHLARFPFVKGLDAFDFSYQPSLDKKQVQTLATCHFIEHGDNLVILGPPGVGKTHLAVGLGLKAIERGYRVLFTTAATMIATLTKALTEGRLDEKLKLYTVPRLLIVDEIGYLPIDQHGANLFFQLVSRRHERGPMLLTSNQSFGNWGEVFGDRVIATAILDRILHHAIHPEHPGAVLPPEGQTQNRPREARGGHDVNPGGGEFSLPTPGNFEFPLTHWLYQVQPGTASRRIEFKDGAEMLLELRGAGVVSTVPPSVHAETGETYQWNEEGEPELIDIAVSGGVPSAEARSSP